MDYDGRFIMQKTVDWSLLRSTFGCLLPKGRKNYHRIIHKNNPHFNRQSSERRAELVRALPSREGGRPKVNRKKFQFEFQKIASKRVPCKLVYRWPSESNLSNGEVLRLKLYEHLKV